MYVGVGGRGYIPILWQAFFVFFLYWFESKTNYSLPIQPSTLADTGCASQLQAP